MIKPICPRCYTDMKREFSKGAHYYHCTSCLGLSLTISALKRVVEPAKAAEVWRNGKDQPLNPNAPCPYCRKAMRTFLAFENPPAPELDVCHRCYAVWLDHGELEQLPKKSESERKKELPVEAKRAIAQLEMEKIVRLDYGKVIASTSAPGGIHTVLTLLGMPVEEDRTLRAEPVVTWLLLLFCVVISLVAFRHLDLLLGLAFYPKDPGPIWFVRGITSFFVHGGWLHLIGNMYFLWVFGDNVEDELGKIRYILLVVTAALVGSWAYGFLKPDSAVPLVGASGGISGLMAYYIVRFPHRKFVMQYWFHWFKVSAWVLAALYFLRDFIGVFSQAAGHTHVSHVTHIGGIIVGVLFGWHYRADIKAAKSSARQQA